MVCVSFHSSGGLYLDVGASSTVRSATRRCAGAPGSPLGVLSPLTEGGVVLSPLGMPSPLPPRPTAPPMASVARNPQYEEYEAEFNTMREDMDALGIGASFKPLKPYDKWGRY